MFKTILKEGWEFQKLPDQKAGEAAYIEDRFQQVALPHTWYTDEDPYRGLAVYRKKIMTDPEWETAFLKFDGADQYAFVSVNGIPAGEHRGGYSAFCVQIPSEALKEQELEICVYLTNENTPEISPLTGDFTIFGGLYRPVSLIAGKDSCFDYLYYGTDGFLVRTQIGGDGQGIVQIEPHVLGNQEARIRYEVMDADGCVAASAEGGCSETMQICIPQVHLWDGKKDPYLYTVRGSLYIEDRCTDTVEKRTGFCSRRMDPDKGFFLNGHSVRLNGVSKHQDANEFFNAREEEELDRDLDLIEEIGANAIRLSHYQHAQRTYDECDARGFLVWAEIPMLKMTENEKLLENAKSQLTELILQNLHHPGIFCWGIQNEIGMFADRPYMHEELIRLRDLAHRLDSERLVTAANLYTVKAKSKLNETTDMIGYNVYFGWYYGEMKDYDAYLDRLHEQRPSLPLGMSEYGVDANIRLHAEEPKVRDYSEEYQALYHETVYPIFEKKEYLWGSFVWNMFDFCSAMRKEGGLLNRNAKGLVTYDRQTRKDSFYYYKARWSKEPFLHICSKRFVKRCREAIDIKLYTNQEQAEFFLNGRSFGTAKNNGNGTILFTQVPLSEGETKVEAKAGALTDTCVFLRVSEEEPSYKLPDSQAGTTVKNWFLQEDDIVREGFFSIKDALGELLDHPQAKEVLRKYVPGIVKAVEEKDAIPLGLSFQSILNRNVDAKLDVKALNGELNQIRNE